MNSVKFGTDGLRGRAGSAPLRQSDLIALGNAIVNWAREKYGPQIRVLIGQDPRNSSDWLNATLKSSLLQLNSVIYDAGVLPMPAVCALLKYCNAYDFGIMITASHNAYHDNGIKIIDSNGSKISAIDEQRIEILFNNQTAGACHNFGKIVPAHELAQKYEQQLRSFFPADCLNGISIVLDCANGATSQIAPKLFTSLGASVCTINVNPDGFNINAHCGSLHPQALQQEVIKTNADIGFAFDGDGDRLVVVTRQGTIKDGDDILALLNNHSMYKNTQDIVGTVMSNQGLARYMQSRGKIFHRAPVGDKKVAALMMQKSALLGAEPSGHILAADYLLNSDAIFAALRVIESVIQTNNWHLDTFEKFPQYVRNIPIREKKDINRSDIALAIQECEATIQPGRLLIRYSGTEPILRVLVEHPDNDQADFVIKKLDSILRKYLA
jgi:phosphoglucosamine mutase